MHKARWLSQPHTEVLPWGGVSISSTRALLVVEVGPHLSTDLAPAAQLTPRTTSVKWHCCDQLLKQAPAAARTLKDAGSANLSTAQDMPYNWYEPVDQVLSFLLSLRFRYK
jgi:hypothetical protein